jgi:6-phosphofructokinase
VDGIVKGNFIRLNSVPDELLERIALTPAAALGSTRRKPDAEFCGRIFESFRKNDVRFFFYIGGNDSADTARIVNDLAKQAQYELRVFHIPKTIDNDLLVHDHCPGYGSAARYVASAIMGDYLDGKSLPGIKVDVIMGRNAGWLTAASVLARKYEGDGPHLIYVPEAPVTQAQLLGDVDRVYKKYGRCLIAASEGMCIPDKVIGDHGPRNKLWAEVAADDMAARLKPGEAQNLDLTPDEHGNIQLSGSGALGDFIAGLIKRELGPRQPIDEKTKKPRKLRIRAGDKKGDKKKR